MSRFSIQLTRAAMRELDGLPETARDQIIADLRGLATAPIGRPPRIKRLRGHTGPLYRLRSGDFRVIYRVDGERVTVLSIINRRELDRALRQLGIT